MPRIARIAVGGMVQHVLNRGNGRMRLFQKPGDYAAFVDLMADAAERVAGVRVLGYCVMPNHWHLVLWPRRDGELSAYMRWLSNTHVRRWRQYWHTVGQGHVYQGRFKSFPVQSDRHLLTLLRYVEANPLRAGLVKRAEDWRWSSLRGDRSPDGRALLTPWPVAKPKEWVEIVNEPMGKEQLSAARDSTRRGRPFGSAIWVKQTAERLGLGFTLRPRGRPRKIEKR
ncbi:MAG: transposase [Tepidisphaeraceae bacterium]|jgi:putative transposase